MGFQREMDGLPGSVQRLVQMAVAGLCPVRVTLFGSRARGDHRESSDFDICLEGASGDSAERAAFRIRIDDEAITLHKVDLVFLEELNEEYVKNIRAEGKVLYVR